MYVFQILPKRCKTNNIIIGIAKSPTINVLSYNIQGANIKVMTYPPTAPPK